VRILSKSFGGTKPSTIHYQISIHHCSRGSGLSRLYGMELLEVMYRRRMGLRYQGFRWEQAAQGTDAMKHVIARSHLELVICFSGFQNGQVPSHVPSSVLFNTLVW